MSLTTLVNPIYSWPFDSSNVDSVSGLEPSAQVSPGPGYLQGSAALVTDAPTSNTAIYFPGTASDYMNLGTGQVNVNLTTSNIFVEFWIYMYSGTAYPPIISVGPSASIWNWNLSFDASTLNPRLGMKYNASSLVSSVAVSGYQTWAHVAFSFNNTSAGAGTAYVFTNGQLGGSMALTGLTYDATEITRIGRNNNTAELLNGYIRDLRVVRGGTVPTATFTPDSAQFTYNLPSYVTGSGTTIFTLMGQFITYVPGKYGSAISIMNYPLGNSTLANVYLDYTLTKSLTVVSTGVTVSFWINMNIVRLGTLMAPISIADTSTIQEIYFYKTNVSNSWRFMYYDLVGNQFIGAFTTGVVVPNQWKHYTLVIIPNVLMKCYSDGILNTTTSISTAVMGDMSSSAAHLYVNCYRTTASPSDSLYDDLRIYNTVLTDAQVQALYADSSVNVNYSLPLGPASIVGNVISSNVYTAGRQPDTSVAGQTTYSNVGSYTFTNFGTNIPLTPTTTGLSVSTYFAYTAAPYGGEGLWSCRLTSNVNVTMYARQTGSSDTIFAAYNSNIAAQTSNTINIPQVAGYTGNRAAWVAGRVDHIVFTFTNTSPVVGLMYVNGVLNASATSSNVYIPEDGNYTCYVPGNAFGSIDANMSVYDFRIVNGILSASQVAMLYRKLSGNNVLVPSPSMLLSGTPPFSRLSTSAKSSAVGVFSLRAVLDATALAVQVKRQSDNVTQDFYADRLGNLLTAPVTGKSIVKWLQGSTGNVVTWYDQSGLGNHASQITAGNQPTVNLSNVTISFNGNQWLSNATPTGMFIPLYQNTYSIVTKHQQWSAGAAWSTGNTASFTANSFNGLRWATGNNYENYRGGGFLTFGPQPGTYPVVATVVNNRLTNGAIGYINDVQSGASATIAQNVESIYSQFIGFDANSGSNRMQGELYAVVFFSSALSAADRTIVDTAV